MPQIGQEAGWLQSDTALVRPALACDASTTTSDSYGPSDTDPRQSEERRGRSATWPVGNSWHAQRKGATFQSHCGASHYDTALHSTVRQIPGLTPNGACTVHQERGLRESVAVVRLPACVDTRFQSTSMNETVRRTALARGRRWGALMDAGRVAFGTYNPFCMKSSNEGCDPGRPHALSVGTDSTDLRMTKL
jgi:hypothetical protein